jgi:DNA polymerase III alpha subunit
MKDRTYIEWNKDDIDALGFLKIDVLALGMLTCIRKAFDLLRQYGRSLTLATVPQNDPVVYDMISHVDTIILDKTDIGLGVEKADGSTLTCWRFSSILKK